MFCFLDNVLAWFPYSRNDHTYTVCEHVFKTVHVYLGFHATVMITNNNISQEIFPIEMLIAVKQSI